MDTMAQAGAGLDVRTQADRPWARVGRVAAYVAAVGFFLMTMLYLLDELDLLDSSPRYVRTSAGQLQDEARFWAQVFEHQHRILWDVVIRDMVGPAAFIALIVVGVALRRRSSGDRPERQLLVTFLTAGGLITAISSLLYLGNVEFWRLPWGPIPPGGETSIVAVGRATTAIDNLTIWPEAFGYVVLALGIVCLGLVLRGERPLSTTHLGTLAFVTAGGLAALAIATAMDAETPRSVLSLAVGVVLAPWLCFGLGRAFGREAHR
jgi:hypothetical protein